MTTTRCSPAERAQFRKQAAHTDLPPEPALGTLAQRLDILCARFGVSHRIVLTKAERAALEACRG